MAPGDVVLQTHDPSRCVIAIALLVGLVGCSHSRPMIDLASTIPQAAGVRGAQPIDVPSHARVRTPIVVTTRTVFFELRQVRSEPAGEATLVSVGRLLVTRPDVHLCIEGNCDELVRRSTTSRSDNGEPTRQRTT